MMPPPPRVTLLLNQWREGDQRALDELMPLVYHELHQMARRYMNSQDRGHTLQATALINEAYFRLAGNSEKHFENRAHFFGVAAKAMRHVLVDHARANRSAKRGAAAIRIPLDEGIVASNDRIEGLIALDDALTALAKLHPRQNEVVELRFFGGLSVEETAAILNTSPETVMRDWRAAKAWLHRQLDRTDDA